ncbi:MAG: hypothetical protein OEU36_18690 [Gammaproteobacteria bacterium]|nr:hypothetical protein [Gammaproteobacteria bacterium]
MLGAAWQFVGLAAVVGAMLHTSMATANSECGQEVPCVVGDGKYYASAPAGWDGMTFLPTAVFFHGWSSTAEAVMRNKAMIKAFSDEGVLLIAPNGHNKTWSHVGSPNTLQRSAREELSFLDAVLRDVKRRWPVDEKRLWATGFSQGGSMVWDVACYRGNDYTAFAPISGGFWRPHPSLCPSGAVNLRHIHGTSDNMVPMSGRPIREFHQGDITEGMVLWRKQNGCSAEPDRVETRGILACDIWDQCSSGKEFQLCLHDRGHIRPKDWVRDSYQWVKSLVQ